MKNLLALVSFTCVLIHCQSITVRENDNFYDPEAKAYIYPDSEAAPDSLGQDGQLQYYKVTRRSGGIPAPALQYTIPEGAIPEAVYNYATRPPPEARMENILLPSRNYEQHLTKRVVTPAGTPVEQYLKEVTPTTKTVYNRRAGNYLKPRGQATIRDNPQQAVGVEAQRGLLKQSPFQYVLQSELQQKPQYEIQKPTQQQSEAAALSRYQNALLAHQKVLLETTNQDESKSSIYVNHAIPKKPVRKLVKPKQSATDEDVEYYTQLQQYQQQLQQKQQQFYEQQQPAQVMYQTKLQYPKEHRTEDASVYQQEQPRQYQPQIIQYQQSASPSPRQAKKPRRPVKYQQEFRTIQEGPESPYAYRPSTKTVEPATEQRPVPLRQGPKYLPEPKTARYQPSPLEEAGLKYQQVVVPGQQQPLITYEAALAKLQSEQLGPRPQRTRQQAAYREQEEAQSAKYQVQYAEENQQGANQEDAELEYIRPEQASRLRPAGRGVVYTQPSQGSSVRYYRNLARPVSYSNYE